MELYIIYCRNLRTFKKMSERQQDSRLWCVEAKKVKDAVQFLLKWEKEDKT